MISPTTPAAGVTYFSGISGGAYELTRESIKDSILGQALDHFDYRPVCADAYAKGFRVFIECGPGQTCSRMLAENLAALTTSPRSAPRQAHIAKSMHLCMPWQSPRCMASR